MLPTIDEMATTLVVAYAGAVAGGRPNLPSTLDCLIFEKYAEALDALYEEKGEDAVMRVIGDVRIRFRELRAGRRSDPSKIS